MFQTITRILRAVREVWADSVNERIQSQKLKVNSQLEIESQRNELTNARTKTIRKTAKLLDMQSQHLDAKSGTGGNHNV